MDHDRIATPREADPILARHFTLRDSALIAAIPALYVGAYALRLFHILP